jgi:hypothetical protein
MSSLIKRSNGIYYFVLFENGVRKWVSTGERNKNSALKKFFQTENTNPKASPKPHLQTFITDFLSFAKTLYSAGTVDIYTKSLDNFLKQFGNCTSSDEIKKVSPAR